MIILLGNFNFLDIQMSFPLQAMMSRTQRQYPKIQDFLQRITQSPAYLWALSIEQSL